MADLAAILLATTIFWAYVEFMQFLIIWEENLKTEIPWYLSRIGTAWARALFVSVAFGFFLPFFALLYASRQAQPRGRRYGLRPAADQPGRRQHGGWCCPSLPGPARSGSTSLRCSRSAD